MRRVHTPRCSGRVINHGNGTYECTAADCPGAFASHPWYSSCECAEHNIAGPFDCYPMPHDVRVRRCA